MSNFAIISAILATLTYAATIIITIDTQFRYRNQLKKFDDIMERVKGNRMLLMLLILRANEAEVRRLRKTLKRLMEDERFEEAQDLRDTIKETEENLMKIMHYLEQNSGGGITVRLFERQTGGYEE